MNTGFGKTILFGEHFVVYGLPAVASAIGSSTSAKVSRIDGSNWQIQDDRPATPGYKKKKADEQRDSIERIIKFMKVDLSTSGIKIHFAGDLYAASGIGASAASCTALARALNSEFDLGFGDDMINQAAYEGEKGYHGTPSGIDNTAATYGGLIWYVRNLEGGPNTMDRLSMKKPVELVIANTGVTSSTTEVVADVKRNKEGNPEKYDRIFSHYTDTVEDAKIAFDDYDLKKVGELMNRNQVLLREITVSSEKNETLINAALEAGAYGAKLTGTGRGGNVIALTPGKELQEKVAAALEKMGMGHIYRTTMG